MLSTFSATLASHLLPSPTCPCNPPLSLQTPTSLSTLLEAGSGPLPVLSMIAPPTLLPWPYLNLSVDRSPRGSSPPCLPATSSPWTLLFSVLCCSAGFACPCLSTLQLVAAAVLSTLSVTTALLAPVLASCAPVGSLSSVLLPVCAERLGLLLPAMFLCATSTSTPSASMIAASRSSQMDSRSGAARNLLSGAARRHQRQYQGAALRIARRA